MKAWWESYGLSVTTFASLAISLLHLAVNKGILPDAWKQWAEFLQEAQPLILAALIPMGLRVAASPTNSTTKEL